MDQSNTDCAYAAFDREGRSHKLYVRLPSGQVREWLLPDPPEDRATDAMMRDVLSSCSDTPIVCFEAERLAELLSRPEVLPLARQTLGRLWDLRDMATIWLPSELRYALPDLTDEATSPDVPDVIAQTELVYRRILKVVSSAPKGLLGILRPLLEQEAAFASLPWPDGDPAIQDLAAIADVLPRRPRPRKREPLEDDLPGDIRDLVVRMLSPGGEIEQTHHSYEHRGGQVDMGAEVADALRDEKYLLVEAGTGVGKSLAYLIPAIIWARREGEPVIVSTNTRNLQEQLVSQDLPLLHEALPIDFEAVLLKGRSNYPCIRALVTTAVDAANSLLRSERLAAAYLISWLAQSSAGDVSGVSPHALEIISELPRMLAKVRSQADCCLGRGCSHFDSCPVQIARAYARRADIVVSNHALTFEDTKADILPEYSRIIFDEAHNVENVATDNLSLECSSYTFRMLLRAITGDPYSLSQTVERRLQELDDVVGVEQALEALAQVLPMAEDLADAVDQFGQMVFDFCFMAGSNSYSSNDRASVRLIEQVRALEEWAEVVAAGETTLELGRGLLKQVEAFAQCLGQLDKGARPGSEGVDADTEAVRTRVRDNLGSLATVLNSTGGPTEFVTWAQAWTSRYGDSWSLHAAPVDIGPVLNEALYQHKDSIVFTSATITADGGFDYFRQRVGLDEHRERLVEVAVPSPFDLTEQLLLCIPSDMPAPNESGSPEAITAAIAGICGMSEGGTLVLFTAKTRMRRAFGDLEEDLRSMGLAPLCQDASGPRSALLDRLRSDPRTVLFGLKSFWEGVDVPGDALRCVVICKLPFAVPSDPIIEARQEDVARRGMDPMRDYYIPEAIVGFKQGFGRLIRTVRDTGVVFVLDKRILTKGYGRRFFGSIQRCELSREPLDDCIARGAGWLGKR